MTPADLAATHALCFTTPRPWKAQEFQTLLDSARVRLFGGSNAFLMVRTILDETEVLTLATHPDHRRTGQARALLAQLHDTVQGRVFLEVAANNIAAQTLYKQAGYKVDGRRKDYYRHPDGSRVDALLMARTLGN
ncbi:MAG: GNAT family N-acetyltransferase [Pseudomonadota bacterium]